MENSLDEMGGFDLPTGSECSKKSKRVSITLNLFSCWKFCKIFWTLSIGTTKKDMQEMKDLFNLFDIDGNGSITQEPFNDYLEP